MKQLYMKALLHIVLLTDAADARLLTQSGTLRHIQQLPLGEEGGQHMGEFAERYKADVDGSGSVNSADVVKVYNIIISGRLGTKPTPNHAEAARRNASCVFPLNNDESAVF